MSSFPILTTFEQNWGEKNLVHLIEFDRVEKPNDKSVRQA